MSWLSSAASADLAVKPEVKIPVEGTALAEKVVIAQESGEDGGAAAPFLKAARPYKRGALILAELAIVFGSDALAVESDYRFIGPFASPSGKPAALRALAQMPAVKTALAASPDLSRGKIFDAAIKAHGFPCKVPTSWFSPAQPPADGKAAKDDDGTEVKGRAVFLRSSLLSHSCNPCAVATVLFDKNVPGPAIFVIATGPIAEGERITVSLLPDLAAPKALRHSLLAERFSYKSPSPSLASSPCSCDRCLPPFDDTEGVVCEGKSEPGGVVCSGAQRRHTTTATNDEDASFQSVCSDCSLKGSSDAWEKRTSLLAALDQAIAHALRIGSNNNASPASSAASPDALLAAVENKDHIRTALAAIHLAHPSDTAVLSRLHRLVHALVRPGVLLGRVAEKQPAQPAPQQAVAADAVPAAPGLAASPDDLRDCVAVSQWVVDAAAALPYLDPFLLLEIVTDHALLCGMANDTERGVKAWSLAASLSSTFNPLSTPLSEMYAAFAKKPPRDVKEASVAFRMKGMAEKALGL